MAFCGFADTNGITDTSVSDRSVDWAKTDEKVMNQWKVCVCECAPNSSYLFIFSRKPFDLKALLIPYNAALALLNLYIAIELLIPSISLQYNYVCEPCRQIYSKDELRVTRIRECVLINCRMKFSYFYDDFGIR